LPIKQDYDYPMLHDFITRAASSLPSDSIEKARLHLVHNWAISQADLIKLSLFSIYDVLDDWIVDAVKAENEIVNEMIEKFKAAVKLRTVVEDFTLRSNKDISSYLRN
jgi:hypothetical protein